jgi:single-stranded-DNA-specific exonuclease
MARNARLVAAPRIMKARHVALELAQDSATASGQTVAGLPVSAAPQSSIRAVGWSLAGQTMDLRLAANSRIDIAYRIRENDHPDFGGLEIEVVGLRPVEQPSGPAALRAGRWSP